MNIIIMMGPPGAGKGTYSAAIAARHGYIHLSVGDLLRARAKIDDPLGREVKSMMDQNILLPDELVTRLVAERLQNESVDATIMLDGYPRTLGQAQDLDAIIAAQGHNLKGVIVVEADEEIIISRILARSRNDIDRDREKILKRLFDYNTITVPAIAHYEAQGRIQRIVSEGSIELSVQRVEAALGLPVTFPSCGCDVKP